jgi:NADPH:quinone reductase-like Zn-dependent oxidoreductase
LAVGGHVSLIGASLSPTGIMLDPLLLTGRGITVGAISVGSRADFEAINRAIELHRLCPVIDRTFPVAEAKEAYRHFEGRGHFAKVTYRLLHRMKLSWLAPRPRHPGVDATAQGEFPQLCNCN